MKSQPVQSNSFKNWVAVRDNETQNVLFFPTTGLSLLPLTTMKHTTK